MLAHHVFSPVVGDILPYDAGLFTFQPSCPHFNAAASFSCKVRDVDYGNQYWETIGSIQFFFDTIQFITISTTVKTYNMAIWHKKR